MRFRDALTFLIAVLFVSCGSMSKDSEELFQQKQEEEGFSRAQLQEDIQRFSGVFIDRIGQALFVVAEKKPEAQDAMLRQQLSYSSAAVEIASGQVPEANLLDMLTFIHLAKDRVEKYWIPNVLAPAGEDLLKAFQESEREIKKVANRLLNQEQWKKFYGILAQWMKENPDLVLVERVRLTEVSVVSGEQALARSQEVEGILANIKKAVSTADEGVLLANRALYLSHRFPFLLRLQGRLAAKQILSDSMKSFSNANQELAQMQEEASPLLTELTGLAKQGAATANEVKALLKTYREAFPQKKQQQEEGGEIDLNKIESITESLRKLTENLGGASEAARKTIKASSEEMHDLIWTVSFALLTLFAGTGVVWWGGYYLAKRKGPRKARS